MEGCKELRSILLACEDDSQQMRDYLALIKPLQNQIVSLLSEERSALFIGVCQMIV